MSGAMFKRYMSLVDAWSSDTEFKGNGRNCEGSYLKLVDSTQALASLRQSQPGIRTSSRGSLLARLAHGMPSRLPTTTYVRTKNFSCGHGLDLMHIIVYECTALQVCDYLAIPN